MPKSNLTIPTLLDSPILPRLIVGIGEVSDMTGVSARQIRYWESKGIITSMGDSGSKNRKYDYFNIEKIVQINEFLKQGFTLEGAARRLEESIRKPHKAIITVSDQAEYYVGPTNIIKKRSFNDKVTIDDKHYLFKGYGIHYRTNERLELYRPQFGDQSKYLVKPIE